MMAYKSRSGRWLERLPSCMPVFRGCAPTCLIRESKTGTDISTQTFSANTLALQGSNFVLRLYSLLRPVHIIFVIHHMLFATCITNGLAAEPLGFWASYLWHLQSHWPSFYIVISHRCSSYHQQTTLLHKISHCNWECKHLIVIDCISSKHEQHNNGGVLELIQSGCICLD